MILLLCGTGVLGVVGYLNGYATSAETVGWAPLDLAMLRRRQRFYIASMGLAVLGVLLLIGTIVLSSEKAPNAWNVWGALTAAIGYIMLGAGMAACHWTGILWRAGP